jgi:hypothetical protein
MGYGDSEIEQLARALWGEPNKTLSTKDDIRFGSNGSKSVCPSKGTWYDHEAMIGGGRVDLYAKVHGEKPEASVAAKLHGIARTVTIYRLPGIPDKGDVSDWLAAGGDVSELQQIPLHTAPPRPAQQPSWKSEWQLTDTKQPLPNLFNVMVVLRQHPQLGNLVRYDEMARTAVLVKQIPNTPSGPAIPHPVADADVLAVQEEIQRAGIRRIAKTTVQDGIMLRATQERYHPVKQYLESIRWDGKPRVDSWLSYYLGAEPSESLDEPTKQRKRCYISRIGRLFLIAMIARIMQPGCKADYMMIFEGPQGVLKSSVCRILAGEDWFSDSLPDLSHGDAVRVSMHLRGKWLIEIAEMSSFNAAASHRLKEFLTQTAEQYTPKYGHNEVNEPRQCLFIGSTNEGTYLRDETGGRRFWPVLLGTIDLEALQHDRDQLLAEAFALYTAGQPWWPDREFEAAFMAPEQAARYEDDPWHELINQWVIYNARTRVSVNEILRDVIHLPVGQFGTREQRRVLAILVRMRWTYARIGNDRCYVPPKRVSEG